MGVYRYDTATPMVDPVEVPDLSIEIPGGYSAKGLQTLQVNVLARSDASLLPSHAPPGHFKQCHSRCMAGLQACLSRGTPAHASHDTREILIART